MKNAKRDIIFVGASLLFLDSINFFRLDPDEGKTVLVYGPGIISSESFKTKEEAKKLFSDLVEKIMPKRNTVLFNGCYIITSKISCYLLEPEKKGKGYSLKVFFENGEKLEEFFSLKRTEELRDLISDFNLGKVFSIGKKLTCNFYKINALHRTQFNNIPGYFVDVNGHQILISDDEDKLEDVCDGLFAANDLVPEKNYS